MALLEEGNLLVVSAGESLRAFDLEGFQKWERKTPGANATSALAQLSPITEDGSKITPLAMVSEGGFKVYNSLTGEELSSGSQLPQLSRANKLAVPLPGGGAALFAYDTGSTQVAAVMLTAAAGGATTSAALEAPLGLSALSAASPRGWAALSVDGAAICVVRAADPAGAPAASCQPLSDIAPELRGATVLALSPTSEGYLLVAQQSDSSPAAALLREGSDGALSLITHFPRVAAATPEVALERGPAVGLLEATAEGGLRLTVVDSGSGAALHTEEYSVGAAGLVGRPAGPAPPAAVTGAALGTYRKKDKTEGFRSLVALSDGRLLLLQQRTVVWARDESLATLRDTLFADLPAPAAEAGALEAAATPDWETRFRYQLLGAKVQLKLNTPAEAAELLALRDALSDKNRPTRDVNGFRKVLLGLTGTGRVVALHNGDGRTLWHRAFPPAAAPTRLLPWRTYHDVQHAPEVLALRATTHGSYGAVLNGHTGEEVARLELPHGVAAVVPLHADLHHGPAVQALYLIVDADTDAHAHDGAAHGGGGGSPGCGAAPRVHLLPDTPAARSRFAAAHPSLFFHLHDGAANALCGFGFDARAAAAVGEGAAGGGGGACIPATPIWRLALPGPALAVTGRDPTEPIQSSVKVLSDRTIKHKYLSPNLLFIATGPPPADSASPSAADEPLASEVTALLVDSVSGRVLHRQTHAGARGPVTAVLSENLVLYTLWDVEAGRYLAVSMELYEAAPPPFSVLDYLFNPNATRPVSSFSPAALEVLSEAFYSRLAPTAAAVTRTQQGITAKQLLLATNTDQVYALDRRFVDPRRPRKAKLSTEEMEEGLIPYQDTLPLSPLSYATLGRQVLGLRRLAVEPTRLESSCLLLAAGVDLFYTRLAPAKGFDSLEDDFNYGLLVGALVALTAGAVVMHTMARQTALRQKWK